MALHEPLEIAFAPTPPSLRSRPPLSSLLPVMDALTLIAVSWILGFPLVSIAYGVVTFLILNGDSSRKYRINPRLGDEAGWLLGRVSVALLVLLSVGWVAQLAHIDLLGSGIRELSKVGLAVAGAVFLGRGAAYALGRKAKERGLASEPTLIVGDGELAMGLAETLLEHPEYGLRPIGFLGRPLVRHVALPVLGQVRNVEQVIGDFEVRQRRSHACRQRRRQWHGEQLTQHVLSPIHRVLRLAMPSSRSPCPGRAGS